MLLLLPLPLLELEGIFYLSLLLPLFREKQFPKTVGEGDSSNFFLFCVCAFFFVLSPLPAAVAIVAVVGVVFSDIFPGNLSLSTPICTYVRRRHTLVVVVVVYWGLEPPQHRLQWDTRIYRGQPGKRGEI